MDYKGTETFQLLIKNYHATILIDKWLELDVQTDLRVRRAKTSGLKQRTYYLRTMCERVFRVVKYG